MIPRAALAPPAAKKGPTLKNWPLVKNPQFLSNPHEILEKLLPHEVIIFTNFHKDWTKIVDFLLMTNFWTCPIFLLGSYFYLHVCLSIRPSVRLSVRVSEN